jgi:hypothetical protein
LVSLCMALQPLQNRVTVVNPAKEDLEGFRDWLPAARQMPARFSEFLSTAYGSGPTTR